MIDASPGSVGNNTLGTNDGTGRPLNPFTGAAVRAEHRQARRLLPRARRVLGRRPDSETPPGHWNVIANEVARLPRLREAHRRHRPGARRPRVGRQGLLRAQRRRRTTPPSPAGAVKRVYDSVRPISMIRYMGGLGTVDGSRRAVVRSRRPAARARADRGDHAREQRARRAPRAPRRVTSARSPSAAGRASRPTRAPRSAAIDWIRAKLWVPYQKTTFVTPAFAGFVSGHSTFSRAAAEVMAVITGDAVLPRRPRRVRGTRPTAPASPRRVPRSDDRSQWATYFDASDQAGIWRLCGGIHIPADDFSGRRMGSECGKTAWALAERYYAGTAVA